MTRSFHYNHDSHSLQRSFLHSEYHQNSCNFPLFSAWCKEQVGESCSRVQLWQMNLKELWRRLRMAQKLLLVNWTAFNRFNLIKLLKDPLFRARRKVIMLETRLKLAHFALTTLLSHCYSGGQKKMLPPKKGHALIFNWITFSFDHDTFAAALFPQAARSHKVYFHPVLISFFSNISYWWWGSRTIAQTSPAHPNDSPWGWGLNCVVANPCVK